MPDRAHARRTDPETSHEAARSVDVTERERDFLDALQALGGRGTNEEIVEESGHPWRAITPRAAPLREKGLIREAGERRASTGRMQIVWEIIDDSQLELI